MRVRLLGSFEVEGIAERRLGSRKGRTLLKMLALARGAPLSVDRMRAISRSPTEGSARWLREKAATAASKARSTNGRALRSPTAAGGRSTA